MVIYVAFLQGVDESLLEASSLDGATELQQLLQIKLPMIRPAFTISLFMSLSFCFKIYDQNLALTSGGPFKSTTMVAMDIVNTAFSQREMGLAQAKGMVFFLILMIISVTQVFLSSRKEVENVNIKRKFHAYPFVGIVLAMLWVLPFYLIIVNSFKEKTEIFSNTLGLPQTFTTENYPEAYRELDFTQSFFNTLLITIASVLLISVISAMAAYAIQRSESKVSKIVYYIFVAAMLVTFQSVMIPLVSIYGKLGMLNRGGLIFMHLGFNVSMGVFMFVGALKGIPKSLDEAATIDGASRWQIFFRIIYPMLKPTAVTVALLNAISIWNDYLLPSLVINKPGMQTIPIKMFYFFGAYTKQWHLALAGLLIAIVPVIIFYFFMQKHIIKGVADGAVK